MSVFEEMRPFLESVTYLDTHPRQAPPGPVRAPFVTISRQVGAGGHQLAQALMEAMRDEASPVFDGWRIYDRELCEEILRQADIHFPLQTLAEEGYRTELEDTIITLLGGGSPQCLVVERMFQVIRNLASAGRAIIIGRGGCCLTGSFPRGVHVRLIASERYRIKRVRESTNLSEKDAARLVRSQELHRGKLVKTFFNRDIADPQLYDCVWNTEKTSMNTIARAVMECLRAKVHQQIASRPASCAVRVPVGVGG